MIMLNPYLEKTVSVLIAAILSFLFLTKLFNKCVKCVYNVMSMYQIAALFLVAVD